ncbi:BLUF domain protein [Mucilaginibacter paludis DSM 18603]|uniref:BLUF domain protein n=2 Tax=Mucilaginibacter TaxID=423349 RepID=H1Y0M8_9SPHI|nr:BLUF domain protein [Mucilaginibacter paludis DSM 18603]
MNYLIYISTSIKLFTDADLKNLLTQSRLNNSKHGITGIILYNKGTFFQVLEGEEEQLTITFEKIKHDPRHKGIIIMKTGTVSRRNFPEWSMGFTTTVPDSFSTLPGFVDPAKMNFIYDYNMDHPAINLLRSFTLNNNFVY